MNSNDVVRDFIQASEAWICDYYELDVRYLALATADGPLLMSALVGLNPLGNTDDLSFEIETNTLLAGQSQKKAVSKAALIALLDDLTLGTLVIGARRLSLPTTTQLSHYSEMGNRDRWYSDLHLQVNGDAVHMPSPAQLAKMDHELRMCSPPFDGLSDMLNWLHLSPSISSGSPSTLNIRIHPPVDLLLEKCLLREDQLQVHLQAHPAFDTSSVSLAIRAVPGSGLAARVQVTNHIIWGSVVDGRRDGIATIPATNAEAALVMLLVGGTTVRRHWFTDPSKGSNKRYQAVQHFDSDLRKIRDALLNSSESRKFEQGVASLLFLLGFSALVQIETDSPDLIVVTPAGQLVIVECTIRVADIAEKIGKLVDRKGSLSKTMNMGGQRPTLLAVLVCRLPKDQIAMHDSEVSKRGVLLLTHEDLVTGLDRVRWPSDPDKIVTEALTRLAGGGFG